MTHAGGSAGALRSRPCSQDRDAQVRAVRARLQETLGPYERLATCLQAALVWERPLHSLLLYAAVNALFWFFALSSLRLFFLLFSGLALAVCVDTWRNKIWPEIKVKRLHDSGAESWGLVQPGTLSVPELCQHMAEVWVTATSCASGLIHFKQRSPGKFCVLTSGVFTLLAIVGRYIPGILLFYSSVLAALLFPLAAYHRLWQRLEPALRWLDFSPRGYMMSKPIDNQFLRKPIAGGAAADCSDSEEELAAFCPTFDEAVVAKELDISDSEHSDAEVSYTENGTFNLSRGQTPLTEGSEDLDRHSDPEESFACDLPDFPSINPDATLMEDDDDPSLGLPSLGSARLSGVRRSTLQELESGLLDSDPEEELDLSLGALRQASADLSGRLAGDIAAGMIHAALASAVQPRVRDHRARAYRQQDSSELDTDLDGEDFEMLDQSELNQMDPFGGSAGGRGGGSHQRDSGFLSNLLGKPQ
ncbi:reticulophagy regulator 3 [Denticeps clupeoides]|uniref:RETREG1-3/ARL6IP-like N-terminal reticulon-homology domain-containing protein n=1 Tax=Denticeps clupeoides TaxID=299321 RepID=A0AAY4D297_9TELE|nr:reticulophagy regulator 3 [Denticeps clupeoides]